MARRIPELEMYAVVDPRIAALNDLHWARVPVSCTQPARDGHPGRARRLSQWPTWQMDRSWPARSPARTIIECVTVRTVRRRGLPWQWTTSAFVALGVVAVGLLTVGIERGLL